MGYRSLAFFSFNEKLQLIKYSLGTKLVTSVPQGLKKSYDLLNQISVTDNKIKKVDRYIELSHICNERTYKIYALPNSSDLKVFEQIFLHEEYKTCVEILNSVTESVNTIIDAGANVGYTSMYLKAFFPQANIFSMEPSAVNRIRLNKNLQANAIQNVVVLPNGLWSKSTILGEDNTFRDGLDWSFRLKEVADSNEATIKTLTVSDLLETYSIQLIDFFKIDIEGAEVEVFSGDVSWLNNVKVLAIEIHDEFNCREGIEEKLRNHGFELRYSGELTIGVNRNLCKV